MNLAQCIQRVFVVLAIAWLCLCSRGFLLSTHNGSSRVDVLRLLGMTGLPLLIGCLLAFQVIPWVVRRLGRKG